MNGDPKDEIDEMFIRRPDDRRTLWPMAEDTKRGSPVDVCACGHYRQNHTYAAAGSFGCSGCTMLADSLRMCNCRRFRFASVGQAQQ